MSLAIKGVCLVEGGVSLRGWGGVLPYMGYIGMPGPKWSASFSAILVITRVLILAEFGHFGHNLP